MNILHVIPDVSVGFGGPVMSMKNIIGIWLSAGHSVTVLSIERPDKVVSISASLKIVPPSFPLRFSNSREAAEWLSRSCGNFDAVFVHCIWTALNVRTSLLLRRKRRPYVMIPHGSLDSFDLQKKSLAKRILGPLVIRRCLEGSSGVLCSTKREAECLVTYGARCNVIVLPWPVPGIQSQTDRNKARKALGLRDEDFVILSLGRIDYKKGFPVLLPAVKRLLKVNPRTRLLIVGPDSGGYSKTVRQMADQLGLNGAVTFLPPTVGEEKIRLQRAADCFALPSLNENFGNAVVEAMQQGLPCVISNNVYICDEVERGGAGLICNYDDNKVFDALRQLSESPQLRAKMSVAAIQVAQSYSPDVLQQRYLAMLKGLAGRE